MMNISLKCTILVNLNFKELECLGNFLRVKLFLVNLEFVEFNQTSYKILTLPLTETKRIHYFKSMYFTCLTWHKLKQIIL